MGFRPQSTEIWADLTGVRACVWKPVLGWAGMMCGDGGLQVGQKPLRGHIYTIVPRCLGQKARCPGKAAFFHSPSVSHLGTLHYRSDLPCPYSAGPCLSCTSPNLAHRLVHPPQNPAKMPPPSGAFLCPLYSSLNTEPQ